MQPAVPSPSCSDTSWRDHEEPLVPHPPDYVSIRETVLASPRLMAQTDIQLFELNQRTLWQW